MPPIFSQWAQDLLPMVHFGALQAFVAPLESERFDKVKRGICRCEESGNVSGVGRNFRFDQDDAHRADYQGIGFPKTFPGAVWGKPAQINPWIARGFSTECKILAERQFSMVDNPREGGIFALGAESNDRARALCRY